MGDDLLSDPALRDLLRAATRQDAEAVRAFHAWRRSEALDDVGSAGFLVLPSLVALMEREGIEDPDLGRMRGVGRYVWAANALKLKQLLRALDALAAAGVPTVLMKTAALFARAPAISRKRLPADSDLLVDPTRLRDAAGALRAAGFLAKGLSWDDVDGALPASITAGMPIALPGENGEIDLHWRPVPDLYDPAIAAEFIASAEPMTFHGRRVLVPSAPQHLFAAIARCEPWDAPECFRRLLEGALLLEVPDLRPDWAALEALVRRHGMQPAARAYLGVLADDCGRVVPQDFLDRLDAAITPRAATAWRLRHLPPGERTPLEDRRIQREAMRHRAVPGSAAAPGLVETLSRQYGGDSPFAIRLAWECASRRVSGASIGGPRCLEGFSFPEAAGRWTGVRWALLACPMTEPGFVTLKGHPYAGRAMEARLIVCAGAGVQGHRLPRDREAALRIPARPLASLGGDALVLLHMPDASTPRAAGESMDERLLGFFLRRG